MSGVENTIPNGMNEVLKVIDEARKGETTWEQASDKAAQLMEASEKKTDHGFFNKRGETTQEFYKRAKEVLHTLRAQEKPEEVPSPSKGTKHLL